MAKNAIGMALATEEYGATFFANGANPGGVLEHPGVVKDPDRLRESWHAQFSGINSHKVAVHSSGTGAVLGNSQVSDQRDRPDL
jgi:phage portal protein BeeE